MKAMNTCQQGEATVWYGSSSEDATLSYERISSLEVQMTIVVYRILVCSTRFRKTKSNIETNTTQKIAKT